MTYLAKIISVLFHPIFVFFTFVCWRIFQVTLSWQYYGFNISFCFIIIVLAPLLANFTILYLEDREFSWEGLTNINIKSRRHLILVTTIFQAIGLFTSVYLKNTFNDTLNDIAYCLNGAMFCGILAWIAHFFNIKNSLHTMGICMIIPMAWHFTPGINSLLISLIILLSIVVWARLYLKSHTIKEIIIGSIIGFLGPFIVNLLT